MAWCGSSGSGGVGLIVYEAVIPGAIVQPLLSTTHQARRDGLHRDCGDDGGGEGLRGGGDGGGVDGSGGEGLGGGGEGEGEGGLGGGEGGGGLGGGGDGGGRLGDGGGGEGPSTSVGQAQRAPQLVE